VAKITRKLYWPARNPVNVGMNECAMRERLVTVVPEETDLIGNAGRADSSYAQSTCDEVRKHNLVEVLAARVHDQANYLTNYWVEEATCNKPSIDCSIEPRIVNSVVHVSVDIDVFPLGVDLAKPVKADSRPWLGP
jgi:hypothetical protein